MNTSFKLNDIFLIVTLIILSLTPLLFNIDNDKKSAEIKLNGKIFKKIDLSISEDIVIDTENGHNVIRVENGTIYIIEANCPDKICMKTGKISRVGDIIACVPNNLLIEIKTR